MKEPVREGRDQHVGEQRRRIYGAMTQCHSSTHR